MPTAVLRQSPIVIEGIGEAYASALAGAGMETILDLLRSGPGCVQRAVPRASVAEIRRWFFAALLLQVDEVTPNIAEALVDAGIGSVEELADAGLQRLERAMRKAQQARRLEQEPSLYKLAEIQRAASDLRGTGVAAGRVLDRTSGEPIAGAVVRAASRKDVTDASGRFILERLPEGRARVRVEAAGHLPVSTRLEVRTREFHRRVTIRLVAAVQRPALSSVEGQGKAIVWGRRRTVKIIVRKLADLASGAQLAVRRVTSAGTVRLMHLQRKAVGSEIHAEVVDIDRAALPSGTKLGDVLLYIDGSLSRTTLSRRDVAKSVFERSFGPQPLTLIKRMIRPGRRERKGSIDG